MFEMELTAPWLTSACESLGNMARQTGSPLLISGHQQKGLLAVAASLAADGLCESTISGRACMKCAACALRMGGNHPDLQFLLPQALALEFGFNVEIKSGVKPSQEIRVDDVRMLNDFMHTSASRGGKRYVIVYPFDALNLNAANALLKILEEPGEGLQFLLIGHKVEHLLPTIRSRCRRLDIASPSYQDAVKWLKDNDIENADIALSLSMNDPFVAKDLAGSKNEPLSEALGLRKKWVDWLSSPDLQHTVPSGLDKIGLPSLLELAQRVAYDLTRISNGLKPELFPWMAPKLIWAKKINVQAIARLFQMLENEFKHAEHPLNTRLALEFLGQQWHNHLVRSL